MTQHRDLKRRIRDRMERTGESYVTARQHVLAARDEEPKRPPFDVVEPVDVSAEARRLGLACGAAMFPRLASRVSATAALTRLRDAVLATGRDPTIDVMRALVLHGERPASARAELWDFEEVRAWIRRVRAGIGGASPAGRMLALAIGDVMMIAVAASTRQRTPIVYLQAFDEIVARNPFALL